MSPSSEPVGLKTEGRVPLAREFFPGPGRPERPQGRRYGRGLSGAGREPRLRRSRPLRARQRARREESWGQARKRRSKVNEKVDGRHLSTRSRAGSRSIWTARWRFLPRSQVDIRPIRDVTPLMNRAAAVPDSQRWIAAPRQYRGVAAAPCLEETRASKRQELVQNLEEGPGHRWRGSRTSPTMGPSWDSRRHRWASCTSTDIALAARPIIRPRCSPNRAAGEGQDHQDQSRGPHRIFARA